MGIYKNDFFELTSENDKVYITIHKKGFPILEFDNIVRTLPRLKINNFNQLKSVLNQENAENVAIGYLLPPYDIEVSKDKMTAKLFLYDVSLIEESNREQFKKTVQKMLGDLNVKHGIKEIEFDKITIGKPYIIAEGTPPIKGDDAKITYLEIPERKPVIREDGKADFFDMNFIFEIRKDDWLGEKIPPTKGIEGTNIFGEPVPALPGKDAVLKFDRKSAYLVEEDGKTVIRALESGVVEQQKDVIIVNSHLPINGNVGAETGNIRFDGSVTVKGTVKPGYSIIAGGDISIEGKEGITDAKLIKSINGDVYIRGGIFGLGKSVVEAGGNIYVKHVNEANLTAEKDIVIGVYAIGSKLKATNILVNERRGKIIGGAAIAKEKIITAISGNYLERKTELVIDTINPQEAKKLIQEKADTLKELKEDIVRISSQIEKLEQVVHMLSDVQKETFQKTKDVLQSKIKESEEINAEIQQLLTQVRTKKDYEIHVTKEAHPGTFIQIGRKSTTLNHLTQGRFLLENGELNV